MTLSTFRPKKSLGQNFLVDENIARKIIRAVAPKPDEIIVEIGPGFGVLTKYLVESAKRVVAVEIDRKLAASLADRFGNHPNFELVNADFLQTDLIELVGRSRPFRIVGNIPYHITSPVIFKAFEHRDVIADMVLMIQREVAMRIVSAPDSKNYGILSVFSQLFSVPSIAFHVSRNVFKPKPDVDSTVIQWNFSANRQPSFKDVNLFKKLVKTTFQQRRKMLRTSLRNDSCFAEQVPGLDFDLKRRPENLRPEEFVYLANQMSE